MMRALLVYPTFPKTFWSFEQVLALVGRKALMPPLGLLTVAALLPNDWEFRLADLNVRPLTEADWAWADIILLSAMIVQKADLVAQIREAKRRGKPVVVGGPFATSVPEVPLEAGADYLVLGEGEVTIPRFLEALARGDTHGVFSAGDEKPDISHTPIPRFDLLDLRQYDMMAVQFSRGCPFLCEFCDIITLYGRRPRTKTPGQFIAELDRLVDLGWRRQVFVVDDNFVGNKRNVKAMLRELRPWRRRRGNPFGFDTEVTIDLAKDPELLELMYESGFGALFVGIETPDEESLDLTKKFQNLREPLEQSVEKIVRAGFRVMAGFIIGFDGEKPGAGRRILDFVERVAIPTTTLSLLQALPQTGLWNRLAAEGRLLGTAGDVNQTTLTNYVPTRPIEDLAREYVDAFWELYDPVRYLDRAYRHYEMMGEPLDAPRAFEWPTGGDIRDLFMNIRAFAIVCWRQGVVRETRFKFWHHLAAIWKRSPGLADRFLAVCAHNEHFLAFRGIVRAEIEAQLTEYMTLRARLIGEAERLRPDDSPRASAPRRAMA